MDEGDSHRAVTAVAGSPRLRRHWRRTSRRAVSEVVATILLLALTVSLFSAIFAFVTSFPAPPAQNSNQFQATLTYGLNSTSGLTGISGMKILHLAGPAVSISALIYIKSARNPTGGQFSKPYNLTQGGLPASKVWNLGQTWFVTFGAVDPIPDNLSVYIIASSQLLFSVVLPGQGFVVPPTFVATAVNPAYPYVGGSFNVTATLTGAVNPNSVYVNLGGIPHLATTPVKMTRNATSGQYYYLQAAGVTTTNGTYYAVFNASNPAPYGGTGSTAMAITFTTPSGGGGGSQLFVATFLTPVTTTGQIAQNNLETAVALVTYTGSLSTSVSVHFYANATTGDGPKWTNSAGNWTGTGGPVALTGPGSTTVYSTTTWTVPTNATNKAYTLTAVAAATGVGSAVGSTSVVPSLGATWGYCYPSTCATVKTITSPAKSTCTNSTTSSDTCPYFLMKFWDNSSLAGTYSAVMYLNNSGTPYRIIPVSTGSITAGGSVQLTASKPWAPTKTTLYSITVIATITTSSWTGSVVFTWAYYTAT